MSPNELSEPRQLFTNQEDLAPNQAGDIFAHCVETLFQLVIVPDEDLFRGARRMAIAVGDGGLSSPDLDGQFVIFAMR